VISKLIISKDIDQIVFYQIQIKGGTLCKIFKKKYATDWNDL